MDLRSICVILQNHIFHSTKNWNWYENGGNVGCDKARETNAISKLKFKWKIVAESQKEQLWRGEGMRWFRKFTKIDKCWENVNVSTKPIVRPWNTWKICWKITNIFSLFSLFFFFSNNFVCQQFKKKLHPF